MTHVPMALKVITGPSKKSCSEHTELDPAAMEKSTSSPEVAVAVGRYVAPTGGLTGAVEVNEIVWLLPAAVTKTPSVSNGAGAKTESPPWVKWISQIPVALKVTRPAEIEHTAEELG